MIQELSMPSLAALSLLFLGAALASAPSTTYLNSAEGRLAFDDTGGAGPAVIAVPGMGDLRSEYRYLTPYLTRAGFRVITMDIRGHGESSASWKDYSAHAVGRDLLRLIAQLRLPNATLIGNSFSAGAALWAAHDAPNRVRAAVLIGPVLRNPPVETPWYSKAAMSAGFAGPWRNHLWLAYWSGLFPTHRPADFVAYRNTLNRNLHEPGRMDALQAMLFLSKDDTSAMLAKTALPSLVVMGTKDADFTDPAAEANWIASRTGARIVLVKDAGHYPQTEMPEQVGPPIVGFLKGVR